MTNMKTNVLFTNLLPRKKQNYWQMVFIPTVSMLKNNYDNTYIALTFEWLFWAVTVLIQKDDKKPIYNFKDI